MMDTKHKRAGFTLMEVILALLIMGWMLVAITQVLTMVRQDRDRIHNIQEAQLAGPSVLRLIETDLRGIFTFNLDPIHHLRVRNRVISGYDADTLDFITTTDSLIPFRQEAGEVFRGADINEVGFCLRVSHDFDDFLEIYRREDFGIDDEPFTGGQYSILHDRVKGFNIDIFEEDGPDAEPLDEWGTDDDPEKIGLPARIEISLTIELAPRLVREQLLTDRRTITYLRIIRFPQALRGKVRELEPIAAIPQIQPPTPDGLADPTGTGNTGGPIDPTGQGGPPPGSTGTGRPGGDSVDFSGLEGFGAAGGGGG